ncbi:MAG: UDP-N-acetylmuramate dehydrogenase [Methyloprofundus sp.]|nr:UDP-N-acetylmuramate dehydrogenase [Methyloprofundus sp.]
MIPQFIKINVCLKQHCTLKIGGLADYFVEPETEEQVTEALAFAKEKALSYFVIGHGSNLLFADEGYRGLIIKLADKFAQIEINKNLITVQAGAWMPYVARKAQQAGLAGLEHTVGIPGNIGGIITMNAGSQRKSIATHLKNICVMTEEGEKLMLTPDQCDFGYRQSIFQNKPWIILYAEVECELGDKNQIRSEMREILKERRLKFPRKQPNCGSVFKSNPAMYQQYGPPGKIIEDLGLKGYCIGDVCIAPQHANFFVNTGKAYSKDFSALVTIVRQKVIEEIGLDLESEVLSVK